ncbi:MAG: haloacid dehalogenase type II [Candidatus Rokuibacteriota bacterium]
MDVQALTFDTYGTVVDWRDSVLGQLTEFGAARGLDVDWTAFLTEWKAGYRPGMDRVNRGEWPWTTVEAIYRRRLDELLPRYEIDGLGEADRGHLTRAWWRLHPWPDAVPGLRRLRSRFVLSPLSNGSFAGMVHLARFAGLPWDCVITAENARWYKPRPEVYRTAAELLGLRPAEVMMVAAHNYDLAAARACGFRTAFVPRPAEHGPGQTSDLRPEADWDVVATDFLDLADRLGT